MQSAQLVLLVRILGIIECHALAIGIFDETVCLIAKLSTLIALEIYLFQFHSLQLPRWHATE